MDQFDQQTDRTEGEPEESGGAGDKSSEQEQQGIGTSGLMEQWLEQVEGNPAHLLKNQFMLEERRMIDQQLAPLHEPRPW